MALESCSTLSIEGDDLGYFFLAKDSQRGSRDRSLTIILRDYEWSGIDRDYLDAPEIRLIPIQLLTFNTETETETEE